MNHQRIDDLLYTWAVLRPHFDVPGYLTGAQGGPCSGLSRPEAAAHRRDELEQVDMIIRCMLSRRQMRLVIARYVLKMPSDRRIAERTGFHRKYVGPASDDLREQVHKMLCARLVRPMTNHYILTAGAPTGSILYEAR